MRKIFVAAAVVASFTFGSVAEASPQDDAIAAGKSIFSRVKLPKAKAARYKQHRNRLDSALAVVKELVPKVRTKKGVKAKPALRLALRNVERQTSAIAAILGGLPKWATNRRGISIMNGIGDLAKKMREQVKDTKGRVSLGKRPALVRRKMATYRTLEPPVGQ